MWKIGVGSPPVMTNARKTWLNSQEAGKVREGDNLFRITTGIRLKPLEQN
jgi:hypothetical protein